MFDLLVDLCKTFLVGLNGLFALALSFITSCLSEWCFLSILMFLGMLAIIIVGCVMSQYSDSVAESERLEFLSRVTTRTYITMVLSSTALLLISEFSGVKSHVLYPSALSGFTFVSAYFVYKTWGKHD